MVFLLSLLPPRNQLKFLLVEEGIEEGQQTQGQRKCMSSENIS